MSRFAKYRRVFYIEEPVRGGDTARLLIKVCPHSGVRIGVPEVPESLRPDEVAPAVQSLLSRMLAENRIREYIAWYYTPMALEFTGGLRPQRVVYDCMDELSLFRGAPPKLVDLEQALLDQADLVFTGGLSLFEAKCERHPRVFPFPSSVDVGHFAQARRVTATPADQAETPRPRIGYG
jgi:UDP-galactopyranose mutase